MRLRLTVLLLVAAVFVAAAPRAAAEPRESQIEKIAAAHHVTGRTPGFAVLVVDGGKVVLRQGFGLADVEAKTPIDSKTTFELASLSKTFTGTAVCLLHDRGKLSFDDEVRQYLPELPEGNRRHPLLLSHLLHHTSGLPDYIGMDAPEGSHGDYVTDADFLRLFAKKPDLLAPQFQPGEKYDYCNTNFLLLALVVERVSKKPFGQFMRDEIFEPMGMKHTWVQDRPDAPPRGEGRGSVHAGGYEKKKAGGWKQVWGAPTPAGVDAVLTVGDGAVWSSVEDLALFDAALRAGKLLKPSTWKQAIAPSKTRDGKTNAYGMGWFLELDDEGRTTSYGHEGSWGGFHTAYYRYTDVDRAVIVVGNREDFEVGDAWEEVDALFAEKE